MTAQVASAHEATATVPHQNDAVGAVFLFCIGDDALQFVYGAVNRADAVSLCPTDDRMTFGFQEGVQLGW